MGVARNSLVRAFLEVAESLARQAGRPGLRQAALRRSVSTAYYAVFHALCAVCSDGLVRWSRTDLVDRTYRALDHGAARRKLAVLAGTTGSDPSAKRFSRLFNLLQDSRYDADYERPRVLFSRAEALLLLRDAQEAIELLETLDEDARRRLAVELLVAKPR
ncbi:MAG: hypothetical protein ACRYGP_08055 [Janthinobacterium lividum]